MSQKYYLVVDPWGAEVWDEFRIIKEYGPFWKKQMMHQGKHEQITLENCINDFIAVNWAQEIPAKDATAILREAIEQQHKILQETQNDAS